MRCLLQIEVEWGGHKHVVVVTVEAEIKPTGCLGSCLLTNTPEGLRLDAPYKMFPLGVLFGLGFDTASEVSRRSESSFGE